MSLCLLLLMFFSFVFVWRRCGRVASRYWSPQRVTWACRRRYHRRHSRILIPNNKYVQTNENGITQTTVYCSIYSYIGHALFQRTHIRQRQKQNKKTIELFVFAAFVPFDAFVVWPVYLLRCLPVVFIVPHLFPLIGKRLACVCALHAGDAADAFIFCRPFVGSIFL